jgi:hypothetical protein
MQAYNNAADEAFVTGTFGGITPVRSLDGRGSRTAHGADRGGVSGDDAAIRLMRAAAPWLS